MLPNVTLRLLVVAAAVQASACTARSDPEPDPRPDIDAAQAAFWAAHEEGDAQALTALLTDEAILWAPGMEEVSGREALYAAVEGMFAAMTISDFEIDSRELAVHGDLAYELATYSETLTYQGAEPSAVRGRYLIVWKREADGAWRVHRNMFHFVSGA